MLAGRMLRIGALCGAGYFIAFLVAEIYNSSKLQLPGKLPTTTEGIQRAQFTFLHQHADRLQVLTLIEAFSSIVLVGVALGVYAYLDRRGARLARYTLIYAIVSSLALAGGTIELGNVAISTADRYVSATGAAQTKILHDYLNPTGLLQLIVNFGPTLFGGVIWLGLVGVALIQIQGSRSKVGWATIGAAVLAPIFPALALWCVGASFALFRANRDSGPIGATSAGDQEFEPPAPGPPTTRPPKPQRPAAPAPEPEAVATDISVKVARPPRGTSERRAQPASARGSKGTGRRKRR